MRSIILLCCLVACAGPHRGNGDDDDGSNSGSDGSGSGSGGGAHSDGCGGLSRPWLATGQQPTSIVSGDFDRDGVIDLAVNNTLDYTVSVFHGLGGGHFAPKVDYRVGSPGLAAIDLDHDGKLDLVSGGEMLIGNDDGSFQTEASLSALSATTVAVTGDFDGDGNPDVAGANNYLYVARGLGDRTFAPVKSYASDAQAVTLFAGDLNHDGKLDVVAGAPGFVDVFLGHGDGTFDGKLSYPLDTTGYVAIGDVTGDGIPDLVVPGTSSASVLPGMGNGSFGTAHPLVIKPTYGSLHVALIDLDRDGTLDIVVGDDNDAQIVASHGDGTYSDASTLYHQPYKSTAWLATDLDGDGQPDLAYAGTGVDTVGIMFVDHGAFIAAPEYATATGAADLALVDVDHDQHLDAVVLASTAGTISVLRGAGDGTFAAKRDAATGTSPRGFAVADVDGDGHPDVLALSSNGLDVLRNKGDGTLMAKQSFVAGTGYAIAAADFTSDGRPDAVIAYGTLETVANAGDGTFPSYAAGPSLPSNAGVVVEEMDLDGNGTPDAVVATMTYPSTGGSLVTYAGNGAGGFQQLDLFHLPQSPTSVAGADVNHDGKLDLVVTQLVGYQYQQTSELGSVLVYLGTGGGHFLPPVTYPADVYPQRVSIADVDGDGNPDLVIAGAATEVLHGIGDGTFGPRTPYGAPSLAAVAGDIDGDGSTDIVTTSTIGIEVLRGTCH